MSDETEVFRKLKKEVENAAAEAQRAKGAYDQLTSQLVNEFECSNLKEAEALLAKLEAEAEKSEKQFRKCLNEYEKKWKKE